jgi:hypothetical protein
MDILNQVHQLPGYVNAVNYLSKTWLFEQDMKRNIFRNERELIARYLYCRDSINSETVYHEYVTVGNFLRFIARRNFMIELNGTFSFETSHPYSSAKDGKLMFENFKDLFETKKVFDWVVGIIEKENKKSSSFYYELTKVLNDNNSFIGTKSNNRFREFLNSNFQSDLVKLRPSECTTNPSKIRIKLMQKSLDLFLEK